MLLGVETIHMYFLFVIDVLQIPVPEQMSHTIPSLHELLLKPPVDPA